MARLAIVVAPEVGRVLGVTGTAPAVDTWILDREGNGEAFPGETRIRLPARLTVGPCGRIQEIPPPLPAAAEQASEGRAGARNRGKPMNADNLFLGLQEIEGRAVAVHSKAVQLPGVLRAVADVFKAGSWPMLESAVRRAHVFVETIEGLVGLEGGTTDVLFRLRALKGRVDRQELALQAIHVALASKLAADADGRGVHFTREEALALEAVAYRQISHLSPAPLTSKRAADLPPPGPARRAYLEHAAVCQSCRAVDGGSVGWRRCQDGVRFVRAAVREDKPGVAS